MKRITIYQLSLAELEALPTKQLLGRLNRLRQCELSRSVSDHNNHQEESCLSIEFKDTNTWKTAYAQLKQVLASREHVAKGMALVERRKSKAHENKTSERRSGRIGRR
ncbi:MAG: hypothetical protein HY301_03770 [Verrucomicrobia bacterium]|nr:hypothetical protein [Verrucomicrobiota bacterium]